MHLSVIEFNPMINFMFLDVFDRYSLCYPALNNCYASKEKRSSQDLISIDNNNMSRSYLLFQKSSK